MEKKAAKKRKKRKVLVLVHPAFRPDCAVRGAATETDVWRALRSLGMTVEIAPVKDDLRAFDKVLATFRPDVVFNLLEEFRDEAIFDFHLISYLEALGVPYTGCNPRGLIQSRNKRLSAAVAASLGVRVPKETAVAGSIRPVVKAGLRFPLFVKFTREHASLGIRESSRVRNLAALRRECLRLRKNYTAEILVQEFIPGRDVSVAVWGNSHIETFVPRQLDAGGADRVATERLKFSAHLQRRRRVRSRIFTGDSAQLIRENTARLFVTLDLSGYVRMDYRVTEDQQAYLIDVNANPNLAKAEDFALSALAAGWSYPAVIERVVELAIQYRPRL
jgi:D-alanine-D-alanine ligase